MRSALVIAVCASLAFGAAPAWGSATAAWSPAPGPNGAPDDDEEAVEQAEAAWSRGDWAGVRAVLEPVAEDSGRLGDPRLREKGLCLLADAIVNDAELDEQERRGMAATYLQLLLDADPDWRLPPAIYSPDLFELFVEVQDQRSQQTSKQCQTDLNACQADMAEKSAELEELRSRHVSLQQRYADQDVEVRRQVARSRVFAAIPFGIGHFYNGERALGGVMLGTELAVGAAGLTLILYRTIADGCRRQRGFQRGSLICSNRDIEGILRRRKAEELVGWVFLGSIALDIFLAQFRFKPFKTQTVERVPRRVLDAEGDGSDGGPAGRRRNRKPRAKVRPTAGGDRHGVSLGVSVRF
ncbi:MAG: hypothetical protein KDK70_38230 [Myxococcales bacterium]|nr:hypothetical protein [Myxococcales bacterium]